LQFHQRQNDFRWKQKGFREASHSQQQSLPYLLLKQQRNKLNSGSAAMWLWWLNTPVKGKSQVKWPGRGKRVGLVILLLQRPASSHEILCLSIRMWTSLGGASEILCLVNSIGLCRRPEPDRCVILQWACFLFMMTGEVVGKLQHFTTRRQWALYFCGEQNHMGVSSGLVLLFHSQGERLYSKSIHREELLLVWKKWWQYDGYCIFLFWDGMVKRTTVVDYGTEMKKTTSDHTIQVCVSM